MPFNPTILGQRLREARENTNLSQQVVADSIGLPRTAITQLEAGNRSVSTLELVQLAELYKRPIGEFFGEQELHEDDILVALHRLAPGIDAHADVKKQVQRCLNLCREGCSLEHLLGRSARSGPPAYAVSSPRSASNAVRQGEQVAIQERKRLGLGYKPIADMGELISDQGIWSSGIHLPHEMSGLFLRHASIGMAILVNFSHVRGRKRFSYAHEYAHALLDRDRTATVSTRENAPELIEKRANAFAAALLLPREGVIDFIRSRDKGLPSRHEDAIFDVATDGRIDTQTRPAPGSQAITHQDAALLAHHFGVSYQAAVYRLKSLSLVSQQECAKLLEREAEGKVFLDFLRMLDDLDRPDSQEQQERELKSQIVQLAIEAYRREEISRGKLLDLSKQLELSGRTLLELAEAVKED
ncbi:helix-turn-helix domain-containing protein [Thiocystis violacea]|uniref:helix-turn-helix domain-containing protein n=1 Tax=Thiocystis violacea TaxID=13725 RepID=UPI001908AF16|nr:XRE family transcriptional regulator [Thiocystis violacea]MBK1724156.1 hypothetical protein [Thiocystis violacea]